MTVASDAAAPFASGRRGPNRFRRAYRDAVGGFTGVPQVGSSARRRAELGRLPSQIDMSPVMVHNGSGLTVTVVLQICCCTRSRPVTVTEYTCRAYRDAAAGLVVVTGRKHARRRAELGRLPLADRHVAGNGAMGSRVDGDYNMI